MATPAVGDTISVLREGLEVTDVRAGRVWVKDSEGTVRSYYLNKVGVTVTKKAVKKPEYWPPQNGDVWKSKQNGRVFHVIGDRAYRTSFGDISSPYTTDVLLRDYPDLALEFRNFS